jgi:hypothetical protein
VKGLLIVALHAIAFVAFVPRGGDLEVELAAPDSIAGHASLARAKETTELGPLARRRWTATYRGGYTREVGATALAGPFQQAGACGGRVVVGQKLLDQAAPTVARVIDSELRGTHVLAVGDYVRVDDLQLRFAQIEVHLLDRAFVTDAPHGYIRATANIVFSRLRVPIVLALVPERGGHYHVYARAQVEVDNIALQWISDELGGDKLATRLARHQIDGVFASALAPPPPLDLGDGQELAFGYCAGDLEIAEGAYGALPFAAVLHGQAVHLEAAWSPPPPGVALALDLGPDAMNAILAELWRTGWLDRRLAEVGLDRRFADDPTVAQFLSVRITSPKLALPPVITPAPGGLHLAADARLDLRDGGERTTGRVYGALDFSFAGGHVAADLGALELACERSPRVLVPCYADLVGALRDRGADFHGTLTDAFAHLVTTIFENRHLGTSEVPAELVIQRATPTLAGAILRVDLDATIVAN